MLVEGAEYIGAWLETQPMGGAMYAPRSVRWAVDNQLVFVRTQRSDGRYAHRVDCGQGPTRSNEGKGCHPNGSLPQPGWGPIYLQGLYMASPAVDVAWFLNMTVENMASEYLAELAGSLERYSTSKAIHLLRSFCSSASLPIVVGWYNSCEYLGYDPLFVNIDRKVSYLY